MIKTIVSEELPVKEMFTIKKNVIYGKAAREEPVIANAVKQSPPRLCVVTGTHGDELEGQYVCFELARRLNEHLDNLYGTVEIYPALNPLGV
ncbi:MAG: succinylglutamate desuccinylase/aspartoacylase family protein, partial [Tannerella sp.]|nr:succinylglutamate desuccinylase/aspartoacylase family protein [Tannerella sp.]